MERLTETWGGRYPEPKRLREEVNCLLEAFVDVLRRTIPAGEIAGIYFKGSAQKEWTSPLDYVPEISDVDVHLLFSRDKAAAEYLGSAARALEVQAAVEREFFSAVPEPLHFPRPQLMVINQLIKEKDFTPSPAGVITVLYGCEYPAGKTVDAEAARALDARRLRGEGEFLARFPLHAVDKPARYLWDSLRGLVWRVSPTAPRALSVLGEPLDEVWKANRTRLVAMLRERGEGEFAACYAGFYLAGWDYFLSGYEDRDAGRRAIALGVDVIRRGVEMAESRGGKPADD